MQTPVDCRSVCHQISILQPRELSQQKFF